MVSCQKGSTCHAYAWQVGPFWQDTLDENQTASNAESVSMPWSHNDLLELSAPVYPETAVFGLHIQHISLDVASGDWLMIPGRGQARNEYILLNAHCLKYYPLFRTELHALFKNVEA